MIGFSNGLQMMPGGMTPTGWDLGSMWLTWVLAFLVVIFVVVLVAFFLRREEPKSMSMASSSQNLTEPIKSENAKGNDILSKQPHSAVLAGLVRSLAPTLTDDERRVMDQIVIAGGEVLQSDLPRMTDFSKATVSKAIHGLEVRAIVVREKHKWTYWCKVNPRLIARTLREQPNLGEAHSL